MVNSLLSAIKTYIDDLKNSSNISNARLALGKRDGATSLHIA